MRKIESGKTYHMGIAGRGMANICRSAKSRGESLREYFPEQANDGLTWDDVIDHFANRGNSLIRLLDCNNYDPKTNECLGHDK